MPVDYFYNHLRRSSSIPCLPNRLEEPNPVRRASRPLSRTRIQSVPRYRQNDYELRYQYRPEGTEQMTRVQNHPDPVWYDRRYVSPYLSYWPYYTQSTPPNYYQRHSLKSYLTAPHGVAGTWHSYWHTPQYYKRKAQDWNHLHLDLDTLRF